MSEKKWTPEQLSAIETRGGPILVSAAAGSGKTAVLVERVIRMLTDENDPFDPASVLVVTFTKAAASEMKQRIRASLTERSAADPSNKVLRRCLASIGRLRVSTIDSFCIEFVREHYDRAKVSPDFKLLGEESKQVLKSDCIRELTQEMHYESPEEFGNLCDLFAKGKDDRGAGEDILALYEQSRVHAFPDEWLGGLTAAYGSDPGADDPWRVTLLKSASDHLRAGAKCESRLLELIADTDYEPEWGEALAAHISYVGSLADALPSMGWDEAHDAVAEVGVLKLNASRRTKSGKEYQLARDRLIKNLSSKHYDKAKECLSITDAQDRGDREFLHPKVETLVKAVRRFEGLYAGKKAEMNSLDFDDTTHKAIELLLDTKNGTPVPSDVCLEARKSLRAVFIDEYQDINEAQETLFSTLSGGENTELFMVGDVKQCIYKFRLASPEIFMEKVRTYHPYEEGVFPMKIILGKNFRSAGGILDTVNYTFSQIMSEEAGDIDYTDAEALVKGRAGDDPEEPAFDLNIVIPEGKTDSAGRFELEADCIADYIRDKVAAGTALPDGRPVGYGDFCVLMRTRNNMRTLSDILKMNGIPCTLDDEGRYFDLPEIRALCAYLQVLDNPLSDLALLSVLNYPVFGFTPDDLANIRMTDRSAPLWSCLNAAAEDGDEKAKAFVEHVKGHRRLTSCMSVGDLIDLVAEENLYDCVSRSQTGSVNCASNIARFSQIAEDVSGGRNMSLGSFLRFIEKFRADSGKMKAVGEGAGSDAVKIMTMHGSKGLEFPYVILADLSRGSGNDNDDFITDPALGVGAMINDPRELTKYPTCGLLACRVAKETSEKSEAVRLLYVAMTRAREKLAVFVTPNVSDKTGTAKDTEVSLGEFGKLAVSLGECEKIDPYIVLGASNFTEMLLPAILRDPRASELRSFCRFVPPPAAEGPAVAEKLLRPYSGLEFVISPDGEEEPDVDDAEIDDAGLEEPDGESRYDEPDYDEELKEKYKQALKPLLDYVYPYTPLGSVDSKRTASQPAEGLFSPEYSAMSYPDFGDGDGMTAAKRGTANHKYLQYCDFRAASEDPRAEGGRLVSAGRLTPGELAAVDLRGIARFLGSEVGRRILDADEVHREFSFSIFMKAHELYPDCPEEAKDEDILVQGMADLVFIKDGSVVLLDYKTDGVRDPEELKRRYEGQLAIYKRGVREVFGVDAGETFIFSLKLGTAISI